jgi:hypothetical protein
MFWQKPSILNTLKSLSPASLSIILLQSFRNISKQALYIINIFISITTKFFNRINLFQSIKKVFSIIILSIFLLIFVILRYINKDCHSQIAITVPFYIFRLYAYKFNSESQFTDYLPASFSRCSYFSAATFSAFSKSSSARSGKERVREL